MAPANNYNRLLTEAILWDRMPCLSKALSVEVIGLDEVPNAYACFDQGSPAKLVIVPHRLLSV